MIDRVPPALRGVRPLGLFRPVRPWRARRWHPSGWSWPRGPASA